MRLLLVVLLLVLTSCATWRPQSLQTIMDDFKHDCAANGVKLKLTDLNEFRYVSAKEMQDIPTADQWTIGMCIRYGHGIYADVLILYPVDYGPLDFLVYHELAHALLGKDHFVGGLDIMNPIMPSVVSAAEIKRLKQKMFDRFKAEQQD